MQTSNWARFNAELRIETTDRQRDNDNITLSAALLTRWTAYGQHVDPVNTVHNSVKLMLTLP